MIEFLTSWIQGIIIAVIIATIIEMILPEGNSKKYIKVVIGVFILYNIITPVIQKISGGKIDIVSTVGKYFEEIQTKEVSSQGLENTNSSSIKDIYVTNLEKDIKAKLEAKGYTVQKIKIEAKEDESYTVTKVQIDGIFLNKEKKEQEENKENKISVEVQINEVKIGEGKVEVKEEAKRSLSKEKQEEIKKYIEDTYEIKQNLIKINE